MSIMARIEKAQSAKRQDGFTEKSISDVSAFQQWAEYHNGKCDYSALNKTLQWAKGHNVSLNLLKMHYESIKA